MKDWIIFLGASLDQVAGIRKCQEMGYKVVAYDQNPDSPGFDLADGFAVYSTHDVEGIKHHVEICQTMRLIGKIAGVLTMGSDIPHIVAELAQHFGTPHVPLETAQVCTNKYEMKECLHKAVRVPIYGKAYETWHLKEKTDIRKSVLKPVDRSGARGVYVIEKGTDFDTCSKLLLRCKAWSYSGEVIVEEWLDGLQLSTETVMLDGRAMFTAIAERNYEHLERFAPLVIENGGWMPALLSEDERARTIEVIEQAALALGITTGIAKGDLVYTDTGPHVIEMACRLSGGDMSESLIPLSTGFDMLAAGVRLAVGDWHKGPGKADVPDRVVCNRYFFPPPGLLVSVSGYERVREQPWIHKLELWYEVGDTIPPITNHGSRAGVFVLEAKDRDEMQERIDWVYNTLLLEVEP